MKAFLIIIKKKKKVWSTDVQTHDMQDMWEQQETISDGLLCIHGKFSTK